MKGWQMIVFVGFIACLFMWTLVALPFVLLSIGLSWFTDLLMLPARSFVNEVFPDWKDRFNRWL
jgi:hypothetical protein